MVTEAMQSETDRAIGICDTPTELFERTAHALGRRPDRCYFDYFGLNHLGWVREVYADGAPRLGRLWRAPERLRAIYKAPLFDAEALGELKLLPTEYVYYYDQPERAFENVRRAGRTRGQTIAELTGVLFDALSDAAADHVAIYRSYLSTRSAGYMEIESGGESTAPAFTPELSGYDKIALAVVRAIHFNQSRIIPLNVRNGGAIVDLNDDDVVEVPCTVNAEGARPIGSLRAPAAVRDLLRAVKEYERLTVDAALEPTESAARRALASHPLVGDDAIAGKLLESLKWEV